jgi:hypothetical protein
MHCAYRSAWPTLAMRSGRTRCMHMCNCISCSTTMCSWSNGSAAARWDAHAACSHAAQTFAFVRILCVWGMYFVQVYSIFAITFNRYTAIVLPTAHAVVSPHARTHTHAIVQSMWTASRTRAVIGGTWLMGWMWNVPFMLTLCHAYNKVEYNNASDVYTLQLPLCHDDGQVCASCTRAPGTVCISV